MMDVDSESAERTLQKETIVHNSLKNVWDAWTTTRGVEAFFAPKANVELRKGGPYELYFDPEDKAQSTKGLKILSYLPMEMLSFEWNAPPQFSIVRGSPGWVVVQLRELGSRQIHVRLTHLGWKKGPQWDQAYDYFMRAWTIVLERLKYRFAQGPVDWNDPYIPPESERSARKPDGQP